MGDGYGNRRTPPNLITHYALRITLFVLLAACAPRPAGTPAAALPTAPPPAFTLLPSAPTPAPAEPTAEPTATLEPTIAPTPAPALVRLTEPGCCVQPFWSPDGSRIFFIDKPAPEAPSGLYAIDPSQPGSPPEFFSDKPGFYSTDMSLLAYPGRGLVMIENVLTGERWEVNTNGNAAAFSPDGRRMVWQVGGGGGPTNARRRDLYVANVDGSEARFVYTTVGGGAQAWFPDSSRLLVINRPSFDALERQLLVLDLADGSTRPLASSERFSTVRLSPGGSWVAYLVTFAPEPADSGIWLAPTGGGSLKRLDQFGAYQWRDDARLLLIPLDPNRGSHSVWEIDAATGQGRPLTDPAVTSFVIANGDWAVAPDGNSIVFVNAADRALWLLQFS